MKNTAIRILKISKLCILFLFCSTISAQELATMAKNFKSPPAFTKPAIYWYWMNEHVSKDGITKDLEAMSRVGIGEAMIGNIYEGGVPGNIKTLSSDWFDCMRHAIREGSRLGIRISLFNGPGWSQSGGPWVEPQEAMRYLTYCETIVEGSNKQEIVLKTDKHPFQDVAVLAFPLIEDEVIKPQTVTVNVPVDNKAFLTDDDLKSKASFKNIKNQELLIDFTFATDVQIASIGIKPTGMGFSTNCELQYKIGEKYITVKKMFYDRSNTSLQLGPTPDGIMIMTTDAIGRDFRIKMDNLPPNFELSEIQFFTQPKIEKIAEKTLNKLPNTSNPAWNAYMWNDQDTKNKHHFINSKQVINLSEYLKNDRLTWNIPKGKWKIVRFGMTTTGTTNQPAAPSAKGLEIDKMSEKAVQKQYDSFFGKIIEGLNDDEKKSLNRIIVDSYEVGPQNWTDNFQQAFIDATGYDPLPYLPVMTGQVIGSEDISNRFLWDLRRVVADLIAERYVGGFRKVAENNGLKLWLENYGHWGFPSEFLKYGSMSHDVGGEFWAGSGPSEECKLASSAANIYGKNDVYAESFTAGGRGYLWHPATLKRKGDWSYTQGINHVVMHVYIHQPYSDKVPGVNAWFGIEYNRHNTWFEQSGAWIDYQRRASYMLKQGNPVRDICYFIGDDAPQMNGWIDRTLKKGYSYDFINSDVIENRLKVVNGKLVLPSGISYSALVLPPINTMRPAVLSKIAQLVEAGAIVLGQPADRSPSLSNYPMADEQIKEIRDNLWPNFQTNDTMRFVNRVGKGYIYTNYSVNEVLESHAIKEDVSFASDLPLLYTHRRLKDGDDIYFLTNQGDSLINTAIRFRTSDKIPQLWNAVDGTVQKVTDYKETNGQTEIELSLMGGESVFVVFSNKSDVQLSNFDYATKEKATAYTSSIINGKWNIRFVNKWLNQDFSIPNSLLFDWTKSNDERIKYFSGTAQYSINTKIGKLKEGQKVYLVFDSINNIANVKINNKNAGSLWTVPYRLEITPFVKNGQNKIEVEVSNLWVNQLIYQLRKEKENRTVWTLVDVVEKDQKLESSGIIGNVYINITQ